MYAETGVKIFDAVGFNKIAAQIEAAGCLSATDPWKCYREAWRGGMVAPITDTAGAAENIVFACKNGGVASCTEILRQNAALGIGCLSDLISSWHPNIICDCETMKCAEVAALTNEQRDEQQGAGGEQQGAGGIASWMYVAGIGGALGVAYLMLRK